MKKTLTCDECRDLLPRYIERDLSQKHSRRVGDHLDRCAECEAIYRQQRLITRDLAGDLPALGQPDAVRLQKLWGAVQVGMNQPRQSAVERNPLRFLFGLFTLVLTISLPLSLNEAARLLADPALPPTPLIGVEEIGATEAISEVAMAETREPKVAPTSEPTRPNHPNYAPTAVSTDAP